MTNFLPPLSRHERDIDLGYAKRVADITEQQNNNYLLLTGSYAIEALTDAPLTHNDVDTNVFTTDIPKSMGRVGLALSNPSIFPHSSQLEDTKPDRLEYVVQPPDSQPRKIELQFVGITDAQEHETGVDFTLPNSERTVIVPTINTEVTLPNGEIKIFRVKTLPFTLATWALRVSGVALSQKTSRTSIRHRSFPLFGSCPSR